MKKSVAEDWEFEITRCGGNYKSRGSKSNYEIDFPCADGCIEFHLKAKHLEV